MSDEVVTADSIASMLPTGIRARVSEGNGCIEPFLSLLEIDSGKTAGCFFSEYNMPDDLFRERYIAPLLKHLQEGDAA